MLDKQNSDHDRTFDALETDAKAEGQKMDTDFPVKRRKANVSNEKIESPKRSGKKSNRQPLKEIQIEKGCQTIISYRSIIRYWLANPKSDLPTQSG